jgi:hypothetical protein
MPIRTASMPGVLVEEFSDYQDVERAVNFLSTRGLPVEHAMIVGCDLRLVERVVGRLTWPRAALGGAGAGAWFGLFAGVLLSLFALTARSALAVVISCIGFGALFGLIFGLLARTFTRGRHEYVSMSQIVPGRYELMTDPAVADQVRRTLAQPR